MSDEQGALHAGATGHTHYHRDPALQYEEEQRQQPGRHRTAEAAAYARAAAKAAEPMSATREGGRLPRGRRK